MKTRNISRLILLSLAITFFCNTTFSQTGRDLDDERNNFHFGLKAGLNISNIYDTRAEDLSKTFKAGFVGGVFFTIPFGTVVGIQPELLYSKKGYKGSGSIIAERFKYSKNFDYLDVPVQLQLKPHESISLMAGPVFSWLLNKKFSFDDGTISIEDQTAIKNSEIKDFTIGVTGGLDVNLYPVVLSGRVGFDLRDNEGEGTVTNPRFKNVWLQATVGVAF